MSTYKEPFGVRIGRIVPFETDNQNDPKVSIRCVYDCANESVDNFDSFMGNVICSCDFFQKQRASLADEKNNEYTIFGDYAVFKFCELEFYVDAEDAPKVAQLTWYISSTGYMLSRVRRDNKWKTVSLHRFVMGVADPRLIVDHIDGDKLNNRKSNLRICRTRDNAKNRRTRMDNTSGFTGVYYDKRTLKWMSNIVADGKHHFLGYYEKFDDAVVARYCAEQKYFGEFAPHTWQDVENTIQKHNAVMDAVKEKEEEG